MERNWQPRNKLPSKSLQENLPKKTIKNTFSTFFLPILCRLTAMKIDNVGSEYFYASIYLVNHQWSNSPLIISFLCFKNAV